MSDKNSPETLDRVLDATLTRALGEPAKFDVAAGKLALQQALRERAEAPAPVKHRRVPWLAAAAAVAVLTVGGLVASTVDVGSPSATAAEQLVRAADLAEHVTEAPVGPGQYRYVSRRHRSIGEGSGTNEAWTMGSRTEVWIPADYRQEWLERQTREVVPQWVPGHEGEGRPDQGGKDEEFRAPCGKFTYYAADYPDRCTIGSWNNPLPEFVSALPTDPRALYERMVRDGGTDPSGALIVAANGLLSGRLPAEVRANVFRALALLPGLVVTEKRVNLDGVVGVALGIKYYDHFSELIINPYNGEFIGIRETVAQDGTLPKGTVRSVYSVGTAVVDSIGSRP
ncbi:CU044_5270 family protein [Lentzea sp. NPDC051213]|uniref:CU044_5270 family protein n=1 Tax=Lentzea sp. NPDC051213 TaxID=3364126 RepID=UPI003793582D